MAGRYSAVGTACATASGFGFAQINASANAGICLREIKVFNEGTATAIIRIVRATTTAPTATALVEKPWLSDILNATAEGAAVKSVTAGPTLEADNLDAGVVGAAVGSGFVYTYYGEGSGLYIPKGATNGIALVEVTDTANTYTAVFIWDE